MSTHDLRSLYREYVEAAWHQRAEHGAHSDDLGTRQQLGLLPAPGR
ncbi:hypothetical protein [Sorangium sp. So ce117]